MWLFAVILNFLMAILSFLAAIIKIKRSTGVLIDSVGFLYPENMGKDIRITVLLLGASLPKLCWFYVIFCGHVVAIVSFLAAIIKIQRYFAVPGVSVGFLDPENMGIDIRIILLRIVLLLGASLPSYADLMWFLVVILNSLVAILSFLAAIIKIQRSSTVLKWFCWILWPLKHGYRHQNCAARRFTYQVMLLLCDFWQSFKFFGGHCELFGSHHKNSKVTYCSKWFCWIPLPWKHG